MNLSLDMINLSQEESNALEYYFYANKSPQGDRHHYHLSQRSY